ncbi:O-acetyl-ADP-ribose deacetylase MACROD2 [Oopsacas minuta]|uniref:O-acetyl-ADP-ribose deacetylase MACROD2 n=1 Tax=Oopsacas minuta TaxID=111878 RepID=A0AAV7JIU3_9METZ|nr:O-acetyl-ADP-ribose deacetylase MACROD2 [Oopsacas minuta]
MLSLRALRTTLKLTTVCKSSSLTSRLSTHLYNYNSPSILHSQAIRMASSSSPIDSTHESREDKADTNKTDESTTNTDSATTNIEKQTDKDTTSREDRESTPILETTDEARTDSAKSQQLETGEESKNVDMESSNEKEPEKNTPTDEVKQNPKSNKSSSKVVEKPWYLLRSATAPTENREFFENMSIADKRKYYSCGSHYLQLKDIETWPEFQIAKNCKSNSELNNPKTADPAINNKVSIWRGDITKLEIDAIVNAANKSLLGGGGVDGAIHNAAGRSLYNECYALNGCDTGKAKISGGHRLPAKYIIHTVGPIGERRMELESCYKECLHLVKVHNIKSIAFCCVSTGIYGYPNFNAAFTALKIVRKWFEENEYAKTQMQRVIFCVFLKVDYDIYSELSCLFFPTPPPPITSTDTQDRVDKESTPPVSEPKSLLPHASTGVPILTSAVTAPAGIITKQLDKDKAENEGISKADKPETLQETTAGDASSQLEPNAKLPKLEDKEIQSKTKTETEETEKGADKMEEKPAATEGGSTGELEPSAKQPKLEGEEVQSKMQTKVGEIEKGADKMEEKNELVISPDSNQDGNKEKRDSKL